MDKFLRWLGSEKVLESLNDAGNQEGCRPSLLGTLLLQGAWEARFPGNEGVGGLGGPCVLSWPQECK